MERPESKNLILRTIVSELRDIEAIKENTKTLVKHSENVHFDMSAIIFKLKILEDSNKSLEDKINLLTEKLNKITDEMIPDAITTATDPGTPLGGANTVGTSDIVTYRSYELIGDSLMYQFACQEPYAYWYNRAKVSSLCAPNQDTSTILTTLQKQPQRRIDKAIVLIGWDETRNENHLKGEGMISRYTEIIHLLKSKFKARKLILCTVPPVPQKEKNTDFWYVLKRINGFVWSRRANVDGVMTAPVFRNFTFEVTPPVPGKHKFSGKRKFELRNCTFKTVTRCGKKGEECAEKVMLTEAGFRLMLEAVETGIENSKYL